MAKKKIELATPSTLEEAVENLYHAFRRYSAPQYLFDVCIACCMDEKLEREMHRLPLRSLYEKHFYEYNTSAKSTVQPSEEIKYLIPRLFELLANGHEIHHSLELYLDRVGRCPEYMFSELERKALDDFALVFFAEGLREAPGENAKRFLKEDVLSILLMFDIGGFDIDPLLEYWLNDESDAATLHYAQASYFELGAYQRSTNAFASDRLSFQEKLKKWFSNADHRKCFAKRIVDCMTNLSANELRTYVTCDMTQEDVLDKAFLYVAE